MRRPTPGAPRPPRHDPNLAIAVADRPSPSPAPTGQHTPASRTRQPTRSQTLLDPDRVGLYREHRASERNHTALPQLPAKDNSGRAVAYPDPKIVTVAAPTNPVNTTRPPACRSARSTTPTSPYVVILNGGQHTCFEGVLRQTVSDAVHVGQLKGSLWMLVLAVRLAPLHPVASRRVDRERVFTR
jgi:hypothetical protein